MIKILFGSERYKIDAVKEQMLQGVEEMNRLIADDFNSLSTFFSSMSLLGGKKGAVVNIDDLSFLDNKKVKDILASVPDEDALVIIAKSVDKRKKFVKELLTKDIVKECGRCENEAALGKIIRFEAKKQRKVFTPAAEAEFIQRTGYMVDESVSLYHIKNLILDLSEMSEGEIISDTMVKEMVPENIIFDAFSITSLIEKGDVGKIKKMAERLMQEKSASSIPCLSAMLYNFRTAYKLRMGFSAAEVNYFRDNALTKYDSAVLLKCINVCTETIGKIKSGEIADADAIMYCSLKITEVIKNAA